MSGVVNVGQLGEIDPAAIGYRLSLNEVRTPIHKRDSWCRAFGHTKCHSPNSCTRLTIRYSGRPKRQRCLAQARDSLPFPREIAPSKLAAFEPGLLGFRR